MDLRGIRPANSAPLPPSVAMKSILLALLPALLLSNCVGGNRVTSNYLSVQDQKLRTTGSTNVQILQTGGRANSGKNHFLPFSTRLTTAGTVPSTVLTSMFLDDVKGLKAKLSAKGIRGLDEPGIDVTSGSTTKSSFVILGLRGKESLLRALQHPDNAALVKRLSLEHKPRVITAVATTLNYDSTHTAKIEAGATADLTLVGGTGALTVDVGAERKAQVKFSDGTVFAYEMSIPAWQRDMEGNLYIVDLVPDRRSPFNPKPIRGSTLDPAKAPQIPKEQIALIQP